MGRIDIVGIRPSRRSLWYLALVIPAVAVTCLLAVVLIPAAFAPEYGPVSGILTGIVAKCTLAEAKAAGETPDPSREVTVSVLTMDGETPVVSRDLPLTTAGVRYRMSLPAGGTGICLEAWSVSLWTVGVLALSFSARAVSRAVAFFSFASAWRTRLWPIVGTGLSSPGRPRRPALLPVVAAGLLGGLLLLQRSAGRLRFCAAGGLLPRRSFSRGASKAGSARLPARSCAGLLLGLLAGQRGCDPLRPGERVAGVVVAAWRLPEQVVVLFVGRRVGLGHLPREWLEPFLGLVRVLRRVRPDLRAVQRHVLGPPHAQPGAPDQALREQACGRLRELLPEPPRAGPAGRRRGHRGDPG